MVEIWINTIIILIILCSVTVLANLAERQKTLSLIVFAIIIAFNGLLVAIVPLTAIGQYFAPPDDPAALENASENEDSLVDPDAIPELTLGNAIGGMILTLGVAGFLTAFLFRPVRDYAVRFFPKATFPRADVVPAELTPVLRDGFVEMIPTAPYNTVAPAQAQAAGFRPDSMVHVWALAVVLYFVASQLLTYFLTGGLSGVASDIEINYGILLANFLPQVLIPVLGVGLFIRRSPMEALERLGLGFPSLIGVAVAVSTTIALVMMVFGVSLIWMLIVGQETFEEQTQASDALAESINTLGLAFMVAFTAGVGEELAFRGALQPIFGFWFTTITFVLSHTQYTLTPASLIILVVAMSFGLIRRYLDTTTAIMTHFLYNFTLLVLSLAAQEAMPPESSWLLLWFLR